MADFILNGIQFTADNTTLKNAGAKTVKFGNTENGDFSNAATDGIEPFVNAVEIDWNGANLGSYIINTTGQLLSYMSTISQKITNLEKILSDL